MRIAISQRVAYDPSHGERRDALAADWHRFLLRVWPDAVIVPIPNEPGHVSRLLDAVAPDGLVLSGGNDLGSEPGRDDTERACLAAAAARGLPVVGVCRGLQMLAAAAGGRVEATDRARHVATRHPVRCLRDTGWGWTADRTLDVNSFHGFAIPPGGLPAGWVALAEAADRSIEAARSDDGRCTAVMWHPEREAEPDPLDIALFRQCLDRGLSK